MVAEENTEKIGLTLFPKVKYAVATVCVALLVVLMFCGSVILVASNVQVELDNAKIPLLTKEELDLYEEIFPQLIRTVSHANACYIRSISKKETGEICVKLGFYRAKNPKISIFGIKFVQKQGFGLTPEPDKFIFERNGECGKYWKDGPIYEDEF